MSPAPISRRRLIAGTGAALAVAAVPAGVVEALTAEMPSTGSAEAFPVVFDPAAFCRDLLAAGYDVHVARSARPHDRSRASIMITPKPGNGFGEAYGEVMARWADRLDATPDHVERIVEFGFGQLEAATPDPEVSEPRPPWVAGRSGYSRPDR